MRKNNLAFIDLETTGLNAGKHEIIEIGCIITTPELEIIEEIELKVKPERIGDADPVSLKVNQYDSSLWGDAIALEEAMRILSEKTKECVMVGQNVPFDSGFLDLAFERTNIPNGMHHHKLDTVSIAWAKLQNETDISNFSLYELCSHFGIKNERAHTALADARATFLLYKKLMSL